MKRTLIVLLMAGLTAFAATAQLPEGLFVLIDGQYYKGIPKSLQRECLQSMNKIVDKEGNICIHLVLKADCALSDADKATAVSDDQVPGGAGLKQQAATVKTVSVPTKTSRVRYLIENLFFDELPAGLEGVKLQVALLPNRIQRVTAAVRLTDEEKSYAIPADQVPDADSIIAQAAQSLHTITITVAKTPPLRLSVGDKLKPFSGVDTDGLTWSNATAQGKVLVLNFWHTACAPCIAEMPELSEWTQQFPDVNFVAVTWNTAEQIAPIVAKKQFTFRQLASDKQLHEMFGIKVTPATIVIDRQGVIRNITIGTSVRKRANLLATIRTLVAQP